MSTETIIIAENTTTVTKTASQLVQGDLLISEIMPNPDKTTDDLGEWFEIYNNTNSAVNLNGLCIKSGTKTITLTIDATVAPGQYVFMCKDIQGGAGAIYYYGTALSLVNTSGNLQLYNSNKTGATLLSEMTYATSPTGASLSLDPSKLSFAAAQDPSSWCAAQAVYATGDKGTPGAQNQPCN
jgi:hypothetical protein